MSSKPRSKPKAGASQPVRRRRILRDNIQGLVKPSILRLVKRAGGKRASGLVYEEVRGIAKVYLEEFIRDSVTVMEYARRTTVQSSDAFVAMQIHDVHPSIGLDNKGKLSHYHGDTKATGRSKEGPSTGKKAHRFRPGTVALRDARKLQKKSDNLVFRSLPFRRLIREIGQDFKMDLRYTKTFDDLAQFYVEFRLLRTLRGAVTLAIHAGRQTIQPKDIQLARRIMAERA